MHKEIFIIGVGGQGVLTMGEILMIASKNKNYSATLYPFYGSQMRGGETGCIVKIDTDGNRILNPTINSPDDFIILDDKFFDKYKKFENANSKYYKLENVRDKDLNIIMLKKYILDTKLFDEETIIESIKLKFRKEVVYNAKIEKWNKS